MQPCSRLVRNFSPSCKIFSSSARFFPPQRDFFFPTPVETRDIRIAGPKRERINEAFQGENNGRFKSLTLENLILEAGAVEAYKLEFFGGLQC